MRYLSICSGIEAASVAWHPLGWRPLAFSEIEAFPRAVLKHHYPDVPLHGDFTQLRDQPWIVDADLLVGGTPCQAFSIAGLRQSLSDDRGNLSLEFIRLANAIDDLRRDAGRQPAWILWENVPGVLSVSDNAFGAFLGGLVGSDSPIVPRGRWADAGVVAGPQRVAAWRILDAQHFGLAQRRRRVFVLARGGPRGWACADALLPIIDSLSGHPAPRRKAGKDVARPIAGGAEIGCPDISPSLKARDFKGPSSDGDGDGAPLIAHTLRAQAQASRKAGERVARPIDAGSESSSGYRNDADTADNLIAGTIGASCGDWSRDNIGESVVPAVYSIMPQNSGKDYKAREVDVAQPLMAAGPTGGDQGGDYIVQPVTFAIQAGALRENPDAGPDGVGVQADIAYTVEARAEVQAVAFALRGREGGAMPEVSGDQVGALRAASGGSSRDYVAFAQNQRDEVRTMDVAVALAAEPGAKQQTYAHVGSAVRRLTPGEAERLQGFPDDFTLIPWRKGMAPDGPRYKALGNSMATHVMRYIGERIAAVEASSTEAAA